MLDITTQGFPHMYDFIGDTAARGANPVVLVVLTIVIMMYYLLFSYLGTAGVTTTPVQPSPGMTFFEIMLWGVFVFLILINGLQYFFQVDIKTSIKNLFTPIPEIDIAVTTPPDLITEDDSGKYDEHGEIVPEILRHKQVFHIPDNKYTYNDAKAVCAAYGAKLADYSQVENAYREGAEWCGYGWSANQMALYPTQKTTWNGLQKLKDMNMIVEDLELMAGLLQMKMSVLVLIVMDINQR